MAEQKTQPGAQSVAAFLAAIPSETQRADCQELVRLMEDLIGEPPVLWGSTMVGFGTYHYRYASGHAGDAMLAGFAPRKQNITLYLYSGFDQHGDLLARLGKHKTGKGCLYIKQLSDVDTSTLRELVQQSAAELRALYPAS